MCTPINAVIIGYSVIHNLVCNVYRQNAFYNSTSTSKYKIHTVSSKFINITSDNAPNTAVTDPTSTLSQNQLKPSAHIFSLHLLLQFNESRDYGPYRVTNAVTGT